MLALERGRIVHGSVKKLAALVGFDWEERTLPLTDNRGWGTRPRARFQFTSPIRKPLSGAQKVCIYLFDAPRVSR
jgi:hypothetical protein